MFLKRKHVLVNGHRWEYLRFGKGEPIVLIQGFSSSAYFLVPLGRELDEQFSVIIPFLPGFGYTKTLPVNGYQELAEGLENFLEKLEIKNPILVGVSFGGLLGLLITAGQTIEVKKLICISPWWRFDALGHSFIENFERVLLKLPDGVLKKLQKRTLFELLFDYLYLACPFNKRELFKKVFGRFHKMIINLLCRIDLHANKEIFYSFKDVDLTGEYKKINSPVTLVGGSVDDVIPPTEVKNLQKIIGNKAKYVEIENVSHNSILEAPEKLAKVVLENT